MSAVVLVTAFEPFGGEAINPSREAVLRLDAAALGGDIDLRRAVLPVAFGRSVERLRAAIAEHRPGVVICLGQAGGRAEITPERVAINLDDARAPDNEGARPSEVPVVPGGPDAYFSTLPVKAIVAGLRAKGVPASASLSAGTFVCNHVFYALMHLLAAERPGARGGFVHVPYLPEQVLDRPGTPSLSLELLLCGLAEIIRISVAQGPATPR
ncbi:MAG TPA: pyroglutamyl-peptidase I [Polyangiaceae bacterium]|nr:pyroglutamyl-peptidase I [Polyangiaceae bacterium]